MLIDGDKECLEEEKGWVLIIEAVVFDQNQINREEKYGAGQNYTAYFFGEIPRTIKLRVKLNDKDFTHEWSLLGTVNVPGSDGVHTFFRWRTAGYSGGTPINVFRETGGVYTPTSPVGYSGNPSAVSYSDARIVDYAFIYCSNWECSYEYIVGDCDCPDKTKQQLASQDSPNPSEWSDRSWVDSEAGARGHCKHEFAAYNYVEDPLPEPED